MLGFWLYLSLYESLEGFLLVTSSSALMSKRQEIISSLVLHASSGNKKEGIIIILDLISIIYILKTFSSNITL